LDALEAIANPIVGEDVLRLTGVLLYPLAQVPDVYAHIIYIVPVLPAPYLLQQLAVGEGSALLDNES